MIFGLDKCRTLGEFNNIFLCESEMTHMFSYLKCIIFFPGIEQGKFSIILASPEAIMQKEWHNLLRSKVYAEHLIGLVFDEAPCVSDW